MKKDRTQDSDAVIRIRQEASRLGFSSMGIATANSVPEKVSEEYLQTIEAIQYDGLSYLRHHEALRFDPRILLPGCQSVLVVALNYFPEQRQQANTPRISIYAYGKDYHRVLKKKLDKLLAFIRQEIDPAACGRSFADSAPILERYWAEEAGIGWRGKNGLIVLPGCGSFFFLGVLLLSTKLPPDAPIISRCGNCTRCIEACPTGALARDGSGVLAANRCLSYLTIEQAEDLTIDQSQALGGRLYGCDTCQEVCPHNRFARPTLVPEFLPRKELFELTYDNLTPFSETDYQYFFGGTAVKRVGYQGMLRNIRALRGESRCGNPEEEEESCFVRGRYINRSEIATFLHEAKSDENAYLRELAAFLDRWLGTDELMTLYTSGSTGDPQSIVASKEDMKRSAYRTCQYFGLKKGDKVLLSLPLRYVAGQMMVVRALIAGLDLYPVAPSSRPMDHVAIDETFAFAPLVPLQLHTMFEDKELRLKIRNIKTILLGGAMLDRQLEDQLRAEPNAYYMGYGMTETLSHVAIRRINGENRSDYYRPLIGVSIAQDDEGCAIIKQEGEPVLVTNDRIELQPDGSFRVLGRRDNVINSGGIKVQPEEVERILSAYINCPFCLVGLPDKRLGERLVLVAEGVIEPNILSSDRLSSLELPIALKEICCHRIPRTETGKVDRRQLVRELSLSKPDR